MFSGMIEATGKVVKTVPAQKGLRLTIDSNDLDLSDVKLGDSIAVSGVCLTVVGIDGSLLEFDVSFETLSCTCGLEEGREVNLEKALRVSDRLGGHIVSGHVDGVAEVVSFEPEGESMHLAVRAPENLAKYIAAKGSVCLGGVSLTVNEAQGREFHLNLIPHTLSMTSLKFLKKGSRVNLEVDMLARYVERLLHP